MSIALLNWHKNEVAIYPFEPRREQVTTQQVEGITPTKMALQNCHVSFKGHALKRQKDL